MAKVHEAGEGRFRDGSLVGKDFAKLVGEAVGVGEDGVGGDFRVFWKQLWVTRPAHFNAAEEIGFRAGHAEEADRAPAQLVAEDLRVRLEADGGAAPVGCGADLGELAHRGAAREFLAIHSAVAGDFDLDVLGERIDDRDADAVQAAGGGIGLVREFAARVQRRHDDFEGGFLGEFRVGVDRDAPAVIGVGEEGVGGELDLDAVGVPGNGLVHRVVEHFGEEVVVGAFVSAADIHAGALTDGLKAFQDLDILGGIAGCASQQVIDGLELPG